MSGKSIKEMLEKIEMEKSMKISREREEDKKIFEIREKARQEYLKRNKMYENISYNQNLNSVSSGGRVAKGISKVKSYITNDTTYFYTPEVMFNLLNNVSYYSTREGNIYYFNDINQLYSLYSNLFENGDLGDNDFGIGTHLKEFDLNDTPSNIILRIGDNEDYKQIVYFQLIKQITPQSELDNPGSSEDGSIGYIVTYSDWNEDSSMDLNSEFTDISFILGGTNFDVRTVDDGPLVDK